MARKIYGDWAEKHDELVQLRSKLLAVAKGTTDEFRTKKDCQVGLLAAPRNRQFGRMLELPEVGPADESEAIEGGRLLDWSKTPRKWKMSARERIHAMLTGQTGDIVTGHMLRRDGSIVWFVGRPYGDSKTGHEFPRRIAVSHMVQLNEIAPMNDEVEAAIGQTQLPSEAAALSEAVLMGLGETTDGLIRDDSAMIALECANDLNLNKPVHYRSPLSSLIEVATGY